MVSWNVTLFGCFLKEIHVNETGVRHKYSSMGSLFRGRDTMNLVTGKGQIMLQQEEIICKQRQRGCRIVIQLRKYAEASPCMETQRDH